MANRTQTARNTVKNETQAAPQTGQPEVTEPKVVSIKTSRPNFFTVQAKEENDRATRKMELLNSSKQALAHASDLYNEGKGKDDEATRISDDAAIRLYLAMREGLASKEEMNAILIDVFGAKERPDGKPSKTPQPRGEAIRKRVVRAVSAADYVAGTDTPTFFADLPKDDVNGILAEMENGGSIWSAYDQLAKLKSENASRTAAAFDPKRMAAIVESLAASDAPSLIYSSPALREVYRQLFKSLAAVGEEMAILEREASED